MKEQVQIEEAQVEAVELTEEQKVEQAKEAQKAALEAKYARFKTLNDKNKASQEGGEPLTEEEITEAQGLYHELSLHELSSRNKELEETVLTLRESGAFLRQRNSIGEQFVNAIAQVTGLEMEEGEEIDLQKLVETVKAEFEA